MTIKVGSQYAHKEELKNVKIIKYKSGILPQTMCNYILCFTFIISETNKTTEFQAVTKY